MMRVSILGLGPGNPDLLTVEGKRAIQEADLLIGGERLLQALPEGKSGRKLVPATRAGEIAACLREAQTGDPGGDEGDLTIDADTGVQAADGGAGVQAAVVMSGDIGLFSGAKSLLGLLGADDGRFDIELIPGISSVQYFAARLKRPWQSWRCVSAHGVSCDPVAELASHQEVFFVTGGANTVSSLCRTLCDSGLGACPVTVGERLSYPDEAVHAGTACDFISRDFDTLSVMLVEAEKPAETVRNEKQASGWTWSQQGIPDECFERTRVPMTKQEVRAIMLSKLKVADGDSVYDIGSGSGSVSVELALLAKEGTVYAIEREPDAVALTKANVDRFGLDNVVVIEGAAPQALKGLPAPEAVFIGGSGGSLKEILDDVIEKNAGVRLCVACVTVETLTEACRLLSGNGYVGFEVCHVSISRSEAVGPYNMIKAHNPIFLVSATGSGARSHREEAGKAAMEPADQPKDML